MVQQVNKQTQPAKKPFMLRRLAKSGSSRYLAVGTILPKDWEDVKVVIEAITDEACILKIIPIR